MIYTAMHGMQRMSSFGQFRTMIGDEALNDFRDEDLVLNIEGLNVEDGCYTWYRSVKDKVADGYNMETGEALCCYKVTRKDELLQDIYLDEDIFPNSGQLLVCCIVFLVWCEFYVFSIHERVAKFSTSVIEGKFVFSQLVYVPVMFSTKINGTETWITE